MNKITTTKDVQGLLGSENIKNRLQEILGRNAATFTTSVLQIVKSNSMLAECEPNSVVGAAMTAATLNLPLNNSLGFAYIVPYNQKQANGTYNKVAQFQIGYKGFIQLGQRSGQYKTINVSEVKQGELAYVDFLTGETEFNWLPRDSKRASLPTIGYVGYIELLNGFRKSWYMTIDELNIHGKKYSKTFGNQYGLWATDFDSMASKTVIKLLLSKYGPLSVDSNMALAVQADQAMITDPEDINEAVYLDNEVVKVDPDKERTVNLIQLADTQEELDLARDSEYGEELLDLIKAKQKELNLKAKK